MNDIPHLDVPTVYERLRAEKGLPPHDNNSTEDMRLLDFSVAMVSIGINHGLQSVKDRCDIGDAKISMV